MQPIDPTEQSRLTQRLVELRVQHRDLDAAIARLQTDIQADELAVKRLKKRKLQLKDCIDLLESALIPDEPA
ncbi:MAG: YdcH family protein [Luteimonas sp.]